MSRPASSSSSAPGARPRRATVPIWLKMVAALIVPLIAVASLSYFQVRQANDKVDQVDEETALASVAVAPGGLVDALIVERGDAVVTILGIRETATFPTKNFTESQAATDIAIKDLRGAVERGGPLAKEAFGDTLSGLEADLKVLRGEVEKATETAGLQHWDLSSENYVNYSEVVDALNAANAELISRISDPDLRAAAGTLDDVNGAHDAVSNLSLMVGRALGPSDPNTARDNVTRTLDRYRSARQSLARRDQGSWADATRAYVDNERYSQIAEQAQHWLDTNEIVLEDFIGLNPAVRRRAAAPMGTTQAIAQRATASLQATIDGLRQDARDEQRQYLIAALAVVIGAAAVAGLMARSVTKPLRSLTRQAEAMATERLPRAVQQVLETAPGEDVVVPQIEPVAVRSRDEVQTVAGALNLVQTSALDLAVEQATLRRHIADSFVSLGRRTQNLIGLQLELITDLEDDEADPAVLESLYRLDHLATRARRNAESLVVLGGTEAQRSGGAPVPMTDVIRAMLSEVEDYQRVDISRIGEAMVLGAIAPDLIHLLAELVENGLSFSPPDKSVEVVGEPTSAGYQLSIVDHGVGMVDDKIQQANVRLAGNETFTVAPSRYLGHYVAGRLAARVGARVTLARSTSSGILATVVLPSSALTTEVPQQSRSGEQAPSAEADRAPAERLDAPGPNDVDGHADGEVPVVKVDGRPPALAPTGGNGNGGAPTVVEQAQVTDSGLRKRTPGQRANPSQVRTPLLRGTGAASAPKPPVPDVPNEEQAQNLASLLTSYTSGLERGRMDAEGTGEPGAEAADPAASTDDPRPDVLDPEPTS